MDAFLAYVEDRRGDERFLGRYWVNSTSGTSGHPGLFVVNRDEWSMELATAIRAFESAGLKLNLARRTRIAQITSTNPSHLSMQGGRDMANWWMPTLLMAASEPLASMVERLNAWRPEMLWAYASIIHLLADEQIAGRLDIAPRTVLSASELLTQRIRRRAAGLLRQPSPENSSQGDDADDADSQRQFQGRKIGMIVIPESFSHRLRLIPEPKEEEIANAATQEQEAPQ